MVVAAVGCLVYCTPVEKRRKDALLELLMECQNYIKKIKSQMSNKKERKVSIKG